MVKLRLPILGTLLGIALIVGGCGGGDDANTEALTKAKFIQRADRICERTDEVQKDALRSYFAKRPDAVVNRALNEKAVVAVGLPPLRTEAAELDALPVPDGDEAEIEAIVDGLEKAIDESEDDPGPLVNSNSAGPFTAVGKLASKYGLKACAFPL